MVKIGTQIQRLRQTSSRVVSDMPLIFGGLVTIAVVVPTTLAILQKAESAPSRPPLGFDVGFLVSGFTPGFDSAGQLAGVATIRHRGEPGAFGVGFQLGQRVPVWPFSLYRQRLNILVENGTVEFGQDDDWKDYSVEVGPGSSVPWYARNILGQNLDAYVFVEKSDTHEAQAGRWFDSAVYLPLF